MTAAAVLPERGSRGRGRELVLLLFALAIAVLADAAVGLGAQGHPPSQMVEYTAGLVVLFLVTHGLVRYAAPYADPLLLPCTVALNGLGVVMIHRLDLEAADKARAVGSAVPRGDAPLQLVWTAVGIAVFAVVLLVVRDHTVLRRYTYTAAAAGLAALLLPVVPGLGRTINGATLWVSLGPVTFQPSEIAKLLLIVFFAGYFVSKRDALSLASRRVLGLDLPRARDLGPVVLAWGASLAVLVRGNDFGTSLLYFGIFVVMLYVATERISWLLIGLGLFLVGGYTAFVLFGHVHRRVETWLHPFADYATSGYQLAQGLFGFGTGGITGTGLGQGRPGTTPFASTDFILAAFGEELGLVGVMALLLLYLLLVERGLRAAITVRDTFGKLLAAGLAFSLALQVFVIAGGVTGLIPLTGVTLPWLSYGGSSVVANWALVALLLRVSDAARRPTPAPIAPEKVRSALEEAQTQVVRRP